MSDLASLQIDDSIATLTMHRPEARNALSLELIEAMEHQLTEIEHDDFPGRVLIVAGEGKAFCSGMDLKGVMSDPVTMADMLRGLSRVTRRLRRLPIPVIARVQGAAVGGGCCACGFTSDFRISSRGFAVGVLVMSTSPCSVFSFA